MKVYLNEITGIADALVSMYMSKRSWTRESETKIRNLCYRVLNPRGGILPQTTIVEQDAHDYNHLMDTLLNWGQRHITMLRFIDFSITVEGLHRAGQDDWDSHAQRFNNRIIRSSTRLATFTDEMSEWYQGKIIPTDLALASLGITTPNSIVSDGSTYVKTTNGYIREDMKNNMDVKRGLYMLSIPSNFIFKCDLTNWSHVYKERNNLGSANPEVKMVSEEIATQVEEFQPKFNRELFMNIKC